MAVLQGALRVDELYALYREGRLVTRRQDETGRRWHVAKKQRLVDAMLRGYSVPSLLLAHAESGEHSRCYEVVDGVQRVHSVIGFLEMRFGVEDGFFDADRFTCTLPADSRRWAVGQPRLSLSRCAAFLEYPLPLTMCVLDRREWAAGTLI